MKLSVKIENCRIRITEPAINDVYYIEQADNDRFYIVSNNGYCGYEGEGYDDITKAIAHVKRMIKDYWVDRCEQAPKGW